MTQSPPTLEDLRHAKSPAWLWDIDRARLVWANAAGTSAFGAASVFELVDTPFDPAEPGLQAMADLKATLQRGTSAPLNLQFPSLAGGRDFSCQCHLHALADGREGLLAIAETPSTFSVPEHARLIEELPVAVVTLEENGDITFANEMARRLFDQRATPSLATLIPVEAALGLLTRLYQTRLVSEIVTYQSPFGPREARLTLRRPQASPEVFALMVMEDVTDRRQLERQMAGETGLAAPLAPQEKLAFEELGRKLSAATAPESKPTSPPEASAKPAPKAASLPPAVKAAPPAQPASADPHAKPGNAFPSFITEALEKQGKPFALMQDHKPAYASRKLASLLGLGDAAHVLQNAEIWQRLEKLPPSGGLVSLRQGDGTEIDLAVERGTLPWRNGRADHFILQPTQAKKPAPAPRREDLAPVATATAPTVASRPPTPAPVPQAEAAAPAPARSKEPEIHSILDIASDGIITLDAKGQILDFSAGAEATFGYARNEVAGKRFDALLSPESAATFRDYLAGLVGEGLASVFNDGREVTGIVKQGGSVPLFLNIGRLQDPQSPAAFCAVIRDITNFKRTERELLEAKEAAEAASRHKSEFLARVSHELRTPLNAIMGFSEIMRMGQFGDVRNDKYQGYLNDIHASGGHLLSMINDLLDLSKIESGRMELNFTAVSLLDCFDNAVRLLQDQATRSRIVIRKAFPENLPRVVADLRAMRQVFSNLLSNAIKYTDAGGQVIASASLAANGALTLRIKDTGIGMTEAEMKQALQPFMRVETPGRERQGTGLGLPLTKALVEANRASFAISSEPGQGTLVEITFPTTRVLAE